MASRHPKVKFSHQFCKPLNRKTAFPPLLCFNHTAKNESTALEECLLSFPAFLISPLHFVSKQTQKKSFFIGYSTLISAMCLPVRVKIIFIWWHFAAVASICCSQKTNVLVFVFFFLCETCCILFPQDYNDEIRQEQLRELSLLNGSDESSRGRSVQGRSARPATTMSTRWQTN